MGKRRITIEALATVLLAMLCAVAAPGGTARAQAPGQAPAAGPVQPWGLPPLPPGVGPVEKFADIGGTALPGSPADFAKVIAEDTEKWGKVIRTAHIKPE